jgi:cytosine/adenosine deaminase-related metal-dependent hydrolase
MTRLVIRGARLSDRTSAGDVAIRDGLIEAVGTIAPEPGDEVLQLGGDIITPGLVNTHHHLYQWATRGYAYDSGLFGWLSTLYPIWARMTPDDVHAAALLGLSELALSGCTTAADHHYVVPNGDDSVFDRIADAARTVGIRAHVARGSMDLGQSQGGLPPDHVVEDRDAILASTQAVFDRLHDGERIFVTVAPCSPFTVTPELMIESAKLARSLGTTLHTHLCETIDEERDAIARYGKRPLELMADWGWIGEDVWFAHGIHFNDAEIALLGRTGSGVAHCPSSNARLAAGQCRTMDLVAAGAPVGLGVDGVASNESGGLFSELRQALFTGRQRTGDPTSIGVHDVLSIATEGGARCLGRPDIGKLEPGYKADLAIWAVDDLDDLPDPVVGLVLGPERRVRHLLVGGEFAVRDGELLGVDLRTARMQLAATAKRLRA